VPAWLVVFGGIFVCTWGGNQFSPLLLMYEELQHYSTVRVDMFLGVYVFGLVPALLITGGLSDRHGRRPVMFAGVLTTLAASASLAFGALGSAPIYAGRLLAGVSVGIAMAVGTSWLKELSQSPHDLRADAGSGARRASLAFALGSGSGALVAGAIAQWGPWKEELPFLIHVALAFPFAWFVLRVPETSTSGGIRGAWWEQLRIPAAGHKRFTRVVLVAAPWLFAAAALAYGYLPVLLRGATGRWGLAYATALTVITLGVAALVQPWAKRIDSVSSARGLVVVLVLFAAGFAVAAAADLEQSILLGLVVSVVLGAGLGIGLVSGLLEVQRIATGKDLAGLTGVFYAAAYCGFLLPTIMAAVTPPFSTFALFLVLTALVAASCLTILASYRRHLPST
jgi:MFS family permease